MRGSRDSAIQFPTLPTVSSALVASALPKDVGVITGLSPVSPPLKAWGPALTVRCTSGDNLALHHALALGRPGEVLVVEMIGTAGRGHFGELMSIAAQVRGIAGVVIDGTIRDAEEIAQRGFPLFSRGRHPLPATKKDRGEVGVGIDISGCHIEPGDGVCADADGIVVVPAILLGQLPAAVEMQIAREMDIAKRLAAGETTISALKLETS